jgi:imidazolonepropionase
LTLDGPDLWVIEDGAMVVQDGLIEWVGKTDELTGYTGPTIDASGRVVMPGFVDSHTHPVFGGSRVNEFDLRCRGASYEEIAASGGGIQSTVSATRSSSEDDLLKLAIANVRRMIQGGTTTIEAKSGYGLSLECELKILRVIGQLPAATGISVVPTFLGAHSVPAEYRDHKEEYLQLVIEEMLPMVVKEGLAEFCDVFCEPAYFSVPEARRLLLAAEAYGMGLKIHADQLTLSGGAELAAEVGAISADHLEKTDLWGISAMKAAGTIPVLLPGSVYGLGLNTYPDARAMISVGLPVALATDFNPGSSPTPSIPMVMSLACTQMGMTPEEAVMGTTIHGARAIGREREIGSLEVGKRADFAIHPVADYRELAYYFGFGREVRVFVGGKEIATN